MNLLERRGNRLLVVRIDALREAVRKTKQERLFRIDATRCAYSNIAPTTVERSLAAIYSQSQQQDKTARNDHWAVVRAKKLLDAPPSPRAEFC